MTLLPDLVEVFFFSDACDSLLLVRVDQHSLIEKGLGRQRENTIVAVVVTGCDYATMLFSAF
jgi:hypothetical protein